MGDTSLLYTIFAMDKASSVNEKVGSSVNKLALGIGVAGAAIAVKTTMMAANFQTNMLKVQTGAGELKSNMASVSNGVLDLATKTGDGSKELATALYTVESGGQHGAAALMVLKAAAQGAKAEGAELNTVADATTSVLQDYHLKATSAALVTSQLVAATGQGKTTFEQLAGSLSAVLPIASAAKIQLSDVVGAIASMTVHGMSAEQASQNLSDTIRHMQAPTMAQVKAMGQLGISSSDVTDKLGSRGITGTLQYLSQTILSKMGPSGKVLLGTFNQSAQAAANVKTMIGSMDPAMQSLAKSFQAGTITSKDWQATLKTLSPEQANQMQQFATLQKRASGFSDAIRSGTPAAVSYTAALRAVTGDATGLNTALMLTGENTTYTNNAVAAIAKTTTEAGNNVKGWSEIQGTFNVRMGQAKEQVEVLGIRVGTALLPYMTSLVTVLGAGVSWLTKHKTVARDAAVVIGTLAAAVLLYKTYQLGANAVEKIGLAYTAAKKIAVATLTGVQGAYNVVMGLSNTTMFTWLGVQALDIANWIRKTALVIADNVALYAQLAAIEAVSIATKLWAAAQWLINVAMDANPVGLIILAVAALVAIIIYLWTHSKTFRDFFIGMWHDIWGFLKTVGAWFAGPFADFFVHAYTVVKSGLTTAALWVHSKIAEVKATLSHAWDTLISGVTTAALWVHTKIDNVVSTVKAIPGRLAAAGRGMWNFIKTEFDGSVNAVIRGWNNLSFRIPAVNTHIPGVGTIGGFTLSTPNIPYLAAGGTATRGGAVVVGDRGPETMFMPAGAAVVADGGRGGRKNAAGGPITICLHISGTAKAAVQQVQAYVREQFGGDVVLALQGHA